MVVVVVVVVVAAAAAAVVVAAVVVAVAELEEVVVTAVVDSYSRQSSYSRSLVSYSVEEGTTLSYSLLVVSVFLESIYW